MKVLTFDIESCTGNPYDGSLCSFGYYLAEDDKKVQAADVVVNPLPKAFTLGKFGREPNVKLAYPVRYFRSQPRFDARYPAIKALFDQAELVLGFAVQNDLRYLNNACDRFALPRLSFRFLDVQLLAGLILPEYKNAGLKAVANHFGVEFLEHRSDEDARVTYLVYRRLLAAYGGTIEELMREKGLVLGKNDQSGHVNCYALEEIGERLAANSKAVRKLLVNHYASFAAANVPAVGTRLAGRSVCLSENLYAADTAYARKVVATVHAEGGTYAKSLTNCDLFIADGKDAYAAKVKKINHRRCRFLTPEEFEAAAGPLRDLPIDDLSVLVEHYAALCTDREPDEKK